MSDRTYRSGWIAIIVLIAIVGVFHIYFGDFDADEGFYIHVIRLVSDGAIPYYDFFFTQAPLMPYVYALMLNGFDITLIHTRWLSLFFGLGAILMSMRAAKNLAGPAAGLFCGVAFLGNFVVIYNFSITKTYALAAFLFTSGIALLQSRRSKEFRYTGALFLFSFATATRLSLAPTVVALAVYIAILERRQFSIAMKSYAIGFLLWCLLFLPWMLPDPEIYFTDIIGCFSWAYSENVSFFSSIAKKLFSTQLLVRDFGVLLVGMPIAASAFVITHKKRLRSAIQENELLVLLSSMFLIVFLVHYYPHAIVREYHIVILPIGAIIVGVFLSRIIDLTPQAHRPCGVFIAVAVIFFAGYPRFTSWFDPTFKNNDWRTLERVINVVESRSERGDRIWTTDPLIAVETELIIPLELALGESSIDTIADEHLSNRMGTYNQSQHDSILEQFSPQIIALRDTDFRINHISWIDKSLAIEQQNKFRQRILASGYELIGEFEDYGAYSEHLEIYARPDRKKADETDSQGQSAK